MPPRWIFQRYGKSNAEEADNMTKLALLGDSIFDSGAYVPPGEEVISQVKAVLGNRAVLLAEDGAITMDVQRQVQRLPDNTTHLAISTGGNDALRSIGVLGEPVSPVSSVAQALARIGAVRENFAFDYKARRHPITLRSSA
jgi:hypothetical protein